MIDHKSNILNNLLPLTTSVASDAQQFQLWSVHKEGKENDKILPVSMLLELYCGPVR